MEMGIIFLLQTGAGILGNSSLLCHYNFNLLTGQKIRPTDLILGHLVLVNNLALFSRGIPQTMAALGWKYFLDDSGCKVVLYLHRVTRGVSLNITCFLNGFQATKLCSGNSWLKFRNRFTKYFCLYGFFFWILQLLVNVYIPIRVTGPRHSQNISVSMNYRYCTWAFQKDF
jgi:vomeronasal1 receptor